MNEDAVEAALDAADMRRKRAKEELLDGNPFKAAEAVLVRESGVTIRLPYRKATTGRAYTSSKDWGIATPDPRGPVSFVTFAHEVGHQLLHRTGKRPRWQEEGEAWDYALKQFNRFALPGQEKAFLDAEKC